MSDPEGRRKAKAGLSRACELNEPVQQPCEVPALENAKTRKQKQATAGCGARARCDGAWYLKDAEKIEANKNSTSGDKQ
jgi:hypothetical protein